MSLQEADSGTRRTSQSIGGGSPARNGAAGQPAPLQRFGSDGLCQPNRTPRGSGQAGELSTTESPSTTAYAAVRSAPAPQSSKCEGGCPSRIFRPPWA